MLVLIVGIAQTEALVLHVAPPTPAKRHKRRITTNPLLTTRRFDQRRVGITAEATMLASYRLGFHAVVGHEGSLCGAAAAHSARMWPKWLRVSDTAERSQVDQRIGHQLHPIVPLLDTFKSEQQSLELVFPGKGALDTPA